MCVHPSPTSSLLRGPTHLLVSLTGITPVSNVCVGLASGGPRFRWLSREKLLQRLLDLRDELKIFPTEKQCGLANKLMNKMWLLQVGYLNDIFMCTQWSKHQHARQEPGNCWSCRKSVFLWLELWLRNVKRRKFAAFPTVAEFFEIWEDTFQDDVKSFIVQHFTELMSEFDRRIPVEHIRTQS